MFTALKHIFRLLTVARMFARYNLLHLFAPLSQKSLSARCVIGMLEIMTSGKELETQSDGKRLAGALQALGPGFIKLGQTLATRPDLLGDAFAHDLSTLQDRLPPFEFSKTAAEVENAFGVSYHEKFASIEETPMAAASIAQVHKAVLHSGETVAVKVLRPNIKHILEQDIATFRWLAQWIERVSTEARRLRLSDIIDMIQATVIEETNLVNEGHSADQLALIMKGEQSYRVPKIFWDYTASNILTLEFIDGTPINNKKALRRLGIDPHELSQTIVSIFLKQAIYHGFFHADLHQGNLFVEADGTIVPIDFGIMGRLDRDTRRFLAEILWGFQLEDYYKIAEVHFDAGYVPQDQSIEEFGEAMRKIAEPILNRPIREISFAQLFADLLNTTRQFSMKTQPQLLLLQRSMVMVEGLAYQLNHDANMWQLSKPLLKQWVQREKLRSFIEATHQILTSVPLGVTFSEHFKERYSSFEWENILTLFAHYVSYFIAFFDELIEFILSLFTPAEPHETTA